MEKQTVLVTGGSGFIGSQCIMQLLENGYNVRGTVRNLQREAEILTTLKSAGAIPGNSLTFYAADLQKNEGWAEAISGCDFVLHVASPFPPNIPKHENELISPAREGALRVLRASRDAGVKRVVMTSSFAAIGYGHKQLDRPFNEEDWSNLDGNLGPYEKSKTLAELAAWEFIDSEGNGLELAVVNPVGVFGPVLGPDYSTSILLVQRLMDGAVPGCPRLSFGIVDVRDVVDLHLKAMTNPAANGERFLAVADHFMSMLGIANTLKERLGNKAKRVPTRMIPDWVVKLNALFDPAVKMVIPELGKIKNATNHKAINLLGWEPRSSKDAIVATAESLWNLGLLKGSKKN